MKKLQLFDQNHGLSPLEKCQFCVLFKCMFVLSWKARFVMRTSPNTFSRFILHETKRTKFQIFHQNHGLAPLEKCQFCGFLNRCVHCPERLVCYIKRRKSFFFYDLFSWSITWEYRGLEGVTGGDKGLQRVTGGYKGWQGVTRGRWGDRRLQRMSETFCLTRTFPDTFSWSILHENQSSRNLKFLTKMMD